MDTRLPTLSELRNPVEDLLADVKSQIVTEVRAQGTRTTAVVISRVLTDREITTLVHWAMVSDWWLEAKQGKDSTKITLKGFVSIMAD